MEWLQSMITSVASRILTLVVVPAGNVCQTDSVPLRMGVDMHKAPAPIQALNNVYQFAITHDPATML